MRGTELARAAGLENVELRCLDLEELPEDLGSFDYILSHGVYSWIPPRARAGLLACVRRALSPAGIAYVSYNAYPGSHLRDMARDILGYHVRDVEDPQQRLTRAQELMQTIVAIEEPSPYAQVLRQHMERMLRYSDALLFHDDLAEISTPFYFHEFIEHATHHHLAFLSEADLFESQMRDVPASAERLMALLPDDVLVREQYLDFFKNRMFRQTLLCHAETPVRRELDDRKVEGCAISSSARLDGSARDQEGRTPDPAQTRAHDAAREWAPSVEHADGHSSARAGVDRLEPSAETFVTAEGFSMTTSEPLVRAAMLALSEAWPAAIDFPQLLTCAQDAAGPDAPAELVAARLRGVLLRAHLARIVELRGCPPYLSPRPGECPLASPLARAQCAAGSTTVSSLLHGSVRLEGELDPELFILLDGTRKRGELSESLGGADTQVAAALQRFASLGLLQG